MEKSRKLVSRTQEQTESGTLNPCKSHTNVGSNFI